MLEGFFPVTLLHFLTCFFSRIILRLMRAPGVSPWQKNTWSKKEEEKNGTLKVKSRPQKI